MAPTSLPAWNQCSNQWEGSEKQAASSCIWDVTEKVHVFLTNQGFWSGGSRNKAGLEAPCGACSAHSVSQHSAGSWKPSVKPSEPGLGSWHHCGTERLFHILREQGCGLPAGGVHCVDWAHCNPSSVFWRGWGSCLWIVLISAVSCYKTCRNHKKVGWGRHRFSWQPWEQCCAAHHSGRLMEDVLVSTGTELFWS